MKMASWHHDTGHIFEISFSKTVPDFAELGDVIVAVFKLENSDVDHAVMVTSSTDQVPFPGGSIIPNASCPTPFVLAVNDGDPWSHRRTARPSRRTRAAA